MDGGWVFGANLVPEDASAESNAPDSTTDATDSAADSTDGTPDSGDSAPDEPSPCPDDMVAVGESCMDRYEAPNRADALPLVMYSFVEAASWCAYRDKRLCFDDEWTAACAGPDDMAFPYGQQHESGVCNDDKAWKTYNQSLLNLWPWHLQTDKVETLDDLLALARAVSGQAALAADHVQSLYQADPSGSHGGCEGVSGVFDLVGNVEEWTRRRDGGQPSFHGNLKGRYWSESRTCQSDIEVHGDAFRFYEIGFRCCQDIQP